MGAVVRDELRPLEPGTPVMVSLDSDHTAIYVWQEIRVYAPHVTIGSYLIVQDVILSYVKRPWRGPLDAVHKLIDADADTKAALGTFIWDHSLEIYGYTGHAYLKRVA